jgi:hypothetical protein
MGWMEDLGAGVGNFFKDSGEFLFGTETAKKAAEITQGVVDASKGIAASGQQMADESAAMGKTYDQGAAQSMGANAADYMQKANQASQQNAANQAALSTRQGAREQIKAMRTGGMNSAASAARAGQQAGRNYAGAYQQGQREGVGQYMQGANQFANQGAEMSGRRAAGLGVQVNALGIQMGGGQEQRSTADAKAQNTANVGQMALGAVLPSDERVKKDIQPANSERIAQILAKIDPVKYKYTDDRLGKGEQIGVTAQNLEDAGLGGAVEETENGSKMVNGAKMEAFNTDAIKMLNDKIDTILTQLGGAK